MQCRHLPGCQDRALCPHTVWAGAREGRSVPNATAVGGPGSDLGDDRAFRGATLGQSRQRPGHGKLQPRLLEERREDQSHCRTLKRPGACSPAGASCPAGGRLCSRGRGLQRPGGPVSPALHRSPRAVWSPDLPQAHPLRSGTRTAGRAVGRTVRRTLGLGLCSRCHRAARPPPTSPRSPRGRWGGILESEQPETKPLRGGDAPWPALHSFPPKAEA